MQEPSKGGFRIISGAVPRSSGFGTMSKNHWQLKQAKEEMRLQDRKKKGIFWEKHRRKTARTRKTVARSAFRGSLSKTSHLKRKRKKEKQPGGSGRGGDCRKRKRNLHTLIQRGKRTLPQGGWQAYGGALLKKKDSRGRSRMAI